MKKMFKNQSQEDCFHLKIGMRSNDSRLARLDGRTKPGRVLIHTRKSLTEHVGGYPTPAERLIIESAAIKSVRLFLLSEKLLTDGVIGCDQQDEKTIAWLNSLRLDLMALGLGRRIKDVSPSLAEIITSTQEQRRSTTPDFPIPPRGGASPARKAMAAAQSARMKARVAKRERAAPAELDARPLAPHEECDDGSAAISAYTASWTQERRAAQAERCKEWWAKKRAAAAARDDAPFEHAEPSVTHAEAAE